MAEDIQELFFDHVIKILSLIGSLTSEWSPVDIANFISTKQKILDQAILFVGCADAVGQRNYSKLMTRLKGVIRVADGRNYDQFVSIRNSAIEVLSLMSQQLKFRNSIDDPVLLEWEGRLRQYIQISGATPQGTDEIEFYRHHMNDLFARINGRPPTVLVVDDDEDVRDAIGSLIGNIPFDIVESSNGHEAWTLIDSRLIDVVVSDFLMPLLNGLELINRMKVERVTTPVILISGYRERLKSMSAIELGAFAFFEKPFSLRSLELYVLKAVGTSLSAITNRELLNSEFAKYLQSTRVTEKDLSGSLPVNSKDDLIMKRRLFDLISES